MTTPLVSVVIASYNSEAFLREAVMSALTQTLRDIEVCIVDDGSTDGTPALLQELASQDARVRHVRQDNAGQASAKNAGARMSRAPLIAFLDADDAWLPTKLEKQVERMQDEKIGVCFTDAMYIDQEGLMFSRPRARYHEGRVTSELFLANFVHFPSTMVRKRLFDEVGGFDESLRMGIDWDLWLRMSVMCEFACVREALVKYRVWPGQMSANIDGRFSGAYAIMARFAQQFPDAVPRPLQRRAWAETRAAHASRLASVGRYREAWSQMAEVIRLTPTRGRVWLDLVRLSRATLASRRRHQ